MRVIGISLLLVLTASVAIATVEIVPTHLVTPENMVEHGISVHSLADEPGCGKSTKMWVQIPLSASTAFLTVRDPSGTVIVNAELAVREHPKDPSLRIGYISPGKDTAPPFLIKAQERFNFLADGFRGVSFCLDDASLQSAKLNLITDRTFTRLNLATDRAYTNWWLYPLSQWAR
jgi:hypothetical protein